MPCLYQCLETGGMEKAAVTGVSSLRPRQTFQNLKVLEQLRRAVEVVLDQAYFLPVWVGSFGTSGRRVVAALAVDAIVRQSAPTHLNPTDAALVLEFD